MEIKYETELNNLEKKTIKEMVNKMKNIIMADAEGEELSLSHEGYAYIFVRNGNIITVKNKIRLM